MGAGSHSARPTDKARLEIFMLTVSASANPRFPLVARGLRLVLIRLGPCAGAAKSVTLGSDQRTTDLHFKERRRCRFVRATASFGEQSLPRSRKLGNVQSRWSCD